MSNRRQSKTERSLSEVVTNNPRRRHFDVELIKLLEGETKPNQSRISDF